MAKNIGVSVKPSEIHIERKEGGQCEVCLAYNITEHPADAIGQLWDYEYLVFETEWYEGIEDDIAADFDAWVERGRQAEADQQAKDASEAKERQDIISAGYLSFVALAQAELLDEVTISEHASLFSVWDEHFTGKAGTILTDPDDKNLYRSIHDVGPGQNTQPSKTPAMWTRIGDPTEEYPEWVQPIGAHDAYAKDDKVSHPHGERNWTSDVDGNVWEPGVYGWTEVV